MSDLPMTEQAARATWLRRRVVIDGLWVFMGQGLTALGTLVGIRILTGIVKPEVFGAVALLMGVAALILGSFGTPLGQAAMRFYSRSETSNSVVPLRQVIRGMLRRLVIPGSVPFIAAAGIYIFGWDGSWEVVVLLALLVIVDIVRTLECSLLNAARRQRPFALWVAAEAWARPLAAAVLVMVMGATTGAVLGGYALASVVVLAVVLVVMPREWFTGENSGGEVPKDMVRDISRYALPLVPLGLVAWVSGLTDRYLIGGMLGLAQAGIYVAAYGLVSRPFLMMGHIMELTLRPVYQNAVARNDLAKANRVLNTWLLLLVPVLSLGFFVVLGWHAQIAALLLGEKFRSGSHLMPWIAGGYAILVVSYVYEQVCYANGATRKILRVRLFGAGACLILTTVAILKAGLLGAAMAVPAYFSVQLIAAVMAGTSARNSGSS